MTETIIEAPLVLTLKCSDDRDSPWLVMRATNLQQLQSMLHELENGSVAVDIGRVAATFQAQARIGSILEAKPLNPAVDGGSFNGVKAAASAPATAAEKPPAASTPPAAAPAKVPAFGGFKAPPAAAKAPATPPPAAKREAAEPPPAAPAAGGFPAAPAWRKP